jgi:dipeptidyl aminopeptidase/acylaminoacyl peptidase
MVQVTPEMCVGGRELTEPRLAPDGRTVAFVQRMAGGAPAVTLVPVDGGPERLLTSVPAPRPGRGLGGGCFSWCPDGSGLVYAASDGNVWFAAHDGSRTVALTDDGTPEQAHGSPVVATGSGLLVTVRDGREVVVTRRRGDAAVVGSADFCQDPAVSPCGTFVRWQAWDVPAMPWDESRLDGVRLPDAGALPSIAAPGVQHQQPLFAPDGTLGFVGDATGWLNVWRDGRPLVDEPHEAAGPSWGPGQRSHAVAPDGARVAFARNEHGFGRLCVVDVATGAITEVARGVHGQISWHGHHLVALRTGGRTPTQIVAYDTASWQRTTLAVGPVAGFDAVPLPEPELVQVRSADGAVLHGRRYRAATRSRGLLCWLHGGPTDQWQVTFLPRIAYWVGTGWDVLVPDHRGSTGHGRAYQQALRERWGDLDTDDIADILTAVHAEGEATPARTVLVGSSAGGFTALNVLARRPGLAAGGYVLYPVSDLASLAEHTHRFEAHYNDTLVGTGEEAVTRSRERSPLAVAHRITVPVCVLHGDADPVVPVEQSVALVERLRAGGADAELVVYEGEGHGFRQTLNQLDEFARMERFLDRCVVG